MCAIAGCRARASYRPSAAEMCNELAASHSDHLVGANEFGMFRQRKAKRLCGFETNDWLKARRRAERFPSYFPPSVEARGVTGESALIGRVPTLPEAAPYSTAHVNSAMARSSQAPVLILTAPYASAIRIAMAVVAAAA
jgi:hypothetical protein